MRRHALDPLLVPSFPGVFCDRDRGHQQPRPTLAPTNHVREKRFATFFPHRNGLLFFPTENNKSHKKRTQHQHFSFSQTQTTQSKQHRHTDKHSTMGNQQAVLGEISAEFIDIIESPAKQLGMGWNKNAENVEPSSARPSSSSAQQGTTTKGGPRSPSRKTQRTGEGVRSPQKPTQLRPRSSKALSQAQARSRALAEPTRTRAPSTNPSEAPLHIVDETHHQPQQPQQQPQQVFRPLPPVETRFEARCTYGKRRPQQILKYTHSCEGNRFITNDEL